MVVQYIIPLHSSLGLLILERLLYPFNPEDHQFCKGITLTRSAPEVVQLTGFSAKLILHDMKRPTYVNQLENI